MKGNQAIAIRTDSPRAKTGASVELEGTSDGLGFFESVALAGLEGQWLRLPVPTQRQFFGANVFGGKAIKVEPDGRVIVFWTTGFGQDWERVELRYSQIRKSFVYDFDGSPWKRKA